MLDLRFYSKNDSIKKIIIILNTDNDSNKKNVAKKRSRKKWSSEAIELNLLDFINHRLMNGTIILNPEKPRVLFYHFFYFNEVKIKHYWKEKETLNT